MEINLENIAITQAAEPQLGDCLSILLDSVLGTYFDPDLARSILADGCKSGNLFVALSGTAVVGFYLVATNGAFLVFPYLHLLAVKTSMRSKGVGRQLLRHFEKSQLEREGYPIRPKAFLLVSGENRRAITFYKKNGYRKKASFEDMFDDGDTELLMMKDLGKKKT